MARILGEKRLRLVLDFVYDKGDATIQEVADGLDLNYGQAQRALGRLGTRGHLERVRMGANGKVVYIAPKLDDPDSDDPLEQAFAAPAFEKS